MRVCEGEGEAEARRRAQEKEILQEVKVKVEGGRCQDVPAGHSLL